MRLDFGFNSNIWQTNLLNLSVVVGIVVRVLGDVVKQVLTDRRRTIIERRKSAQTVWTNSSLEFENYSPLPCAITPDQTQGIAERCYQYAQNARSLLISPSPRSSGRSTRPDVVHLEGVDPHYQMYWVPLKEARVKVITQSAPTPGSPEAKDPILGHTDRFVRQLGSEIGRLETEYNSKVNRAYNLKIRSFRIIEQSMNDAKSQLSELAGTRK